MNPGRKCPPPVYNVIPEPSPDRVKTRQSTACNLRPKRKLKEGNLMFDVLDSWNKPVYTVRNEKSLKGVKKTILAKQKL